MAPGTAVGYYRTSSATNVGEDKDSLKRQQDAVATYAKRMGLTIVREFYDPAVSGADSVESRPGFAEMLAYLLGNGARTVLVENAGRFARDLVVQITGHDLLKSHGIALVPVDSPDHFTQETPTAVMVRNILGAVRQFQKEEVVATLRKARERKKRDTGRCEGRPPVPAAVVAAARRLGRPNRRTKVARSLREIAQELAALNMLAPSGKAYHAGSVRAMLGKKSTS